MLDDSTIQPAIEVGMNQKISIEHKETFDDFQKKGGGQNRGDSFETFVELPEEIGRGSRQEVEVRPGVKLLLEDYQIKENLVVNVVKVKGKSSPLEFCFCVSGNIKCRAQGIKDDFGIDTGQCNLSFLPSPRGTIKYKAGQRMVFVTIRTEPQVFGAFLDGRSDRIPVDLRDIAEGIEKFYYQAGNVTASMKMVIHQILNCPYSGSIKRLYFETKAMELIVHQLAELAAGEKKHSKVCALRSGDMERIHEARDILVGNMQNPPSLLGLAKQAGLNDYKLKIGFNQVFGTTVFGYLRQCRMESARLLFEETEMNVAEVSSTIGYSNPSHFAAAFKKQFGVKPRSYLAETKRRSMF